MIAFMLMKTRMKVSRGGQISIPAVIRHRWGTSTLVLEDQGDRIVLVPAPDDPIAAAEGALAAEYGSLDIARLRRRARADDRAAEDRRHGMILLDAYALVAFLVGGPATSQVRALLREGDAAVTTANLAEALDVSQRVHGLAITRAMEVLEPLFEGSLSSVTLDFATARKAAEIRARHYHRSSRPISLADAILIASTTPGTRIATADPDVLAVAHAEGLESVALPGQG